MKVLIIRLSSFGDIVQALSAAAALKTTYPDTEIHWLVRSDFADIVRHCPFVDQVWSFERSTGLNGLIDLSKKLPTYTHIYDAHNNLRSGILTKLIKSKHFVRRSKNRLQRFLEFQLRLRQFQQPYIAQKSYVSPLEAWGVRWAPPQQKLLKLPTYTQEMPKNPYVTIVPSAAWEMKRWPIESWIHLLGDLKGIPVVLLGGKDDSFIDDLVHMAPGPTLNLAGKLSLLESSSVIAGSRAVVSADTGLMHVADAMHVPTIALIGPSAFGHPTQPSSHVLETQLYCKPCSKDGRGRCRNKVYQKCMKDISPLQVMTALRRIGAVIR